MVGQEGKEPDLAQGGEHQRGSQESPGRAFGTLRDRPGQTQSRRGEHHPDVERRVERLVAARYPEGEVEDEHGQAGEARQL